MGLITKIKSSVEDLSFMDAQLQINLKKKIFF